MRSIQLLDRAIDRRGAVRSLHCVAMRIAAELKPALAIGFIAEPVAIAHSTCSSLSSGIATRAAPPIGSRKKRKKLELGVSSNRVSVLRRAAS